MAARERARARAALRGGRVAARRFEARQRRGGRVCRAARATRRRGRSGSVVHGRCSAPRSRSCTTTTARSPPIPAIAWPTMRPRSASDSVSFSSPHSRARCSRATTTGRASRSGTRATPAASAARAATSRASGFVDTRSPHHQVSLAAQWTMRRTPTLLEVAFAPLYNWDGRRDAIWNQALGVMESNREFNSGRLFVAEQLFRLHRDEYEALFGPMPPLDDATRFPQLTPDTAGCVEVNTSMGSTFACRGVPGDTADYDSMQPADQALVTRRGGQRHEIARRVRARAPLRREPFRRLGRRRRHGALARASSAAPRCSWGAASASPATAGRASPTAPSTTSDSAQPSSPPPFKTKTIAARRQGSRRRSSTR